MRAIEIQERALGPDHPSLASSLGTRAIVLTEQVREYVPETLIVDEREHVDQNILCSLGIAISNGRMTAMICLMLSLELCAVVSIVLA